SRVEAKTAARSSSSWAEADIWRDATGGPKHGRWYGFGSREQTECPWSYFDRYVLSVRAIHRPADAASIFSDDDRGDFESSVGDDGALHTS
ncbi:hypothetical protein Dimus_005425, partial [Dionaea muscipula]